MNVDVDHWTPAHVPALRDAYRDVLPEISDEKFALEHLQMSPRTLYKWQREPDRRLTASTQELLKSFLRTQVPERVRARFREVLTGRGLTQPLPGPGLQSAGLVLAPDEGEVFASVAQEVSVDVALRSVSLGDAPETLHGLATEISGNYSGRALQANFDEARRLRAAARELSTRSYSPAEQADLYVVSGMATALMASMAFDLGHWDAAAKLASGATLDARMAGHNSLAAWSLGLQGTLAFWRNEPRKAIEFVDEGLAVAPNGASRFRLHNILARAHAIAGNPESVLRALQDAQDAREEAEGQHDPLHNGVGGEFEFEDPRAAACAAAAWLAVHDGERAEQYAVQALDQYSAMPDGRRPKSTLSGSRIDAASARLLQGNLEGAQELLVPVLALPVEQRTVSLAGRIAAARNLLVAGNWKGSQTASDLSETLTDWIGDIRSDHG